MNIMNLDKQFEATRSLNPKILGQLKLLLYIIKIRTNPELCHVAIKRIEEEIKDESILKRIRGTMLSGKDRYRPKTPAEMRILKGVMSRLERHFLALNPKTKEQEKAPIEIQKTIPELCRKVRS